MNMRSKVLLVIDSLGSGGGQRQIVNLALSLALNGYRPTVITYSSSNNHFERDLLAGKVDIVHFEKKRRFSLGVARKIRCLIRSGGFSVVVAFLRTPSFYAEISRLGINGVRVIVSERSSFRSGKPKIRDRIAMFGHRLADCVTVNSHFHRECIARVAPSLSRKLVTIYNGYDLVRFRPTVVRRLLDGVMRIVCIGRINEGKNIGNLMRAVRLAKIRGVRLEVNWVGRLDDTSWTSPLYQSLSDLIDELGLASDWKWHGERRNVDELLPHFDCLVHASFFEGLPNAVCEALACGVPVLASRVCDHPRLVGVNSERGYLFDPSNVSDIADAIERFYQLPDAERARMGCAARDFAEQYLSIERMFSEYERVIFSS
jgi:glycosyltransferase involved in cell wall biosynthesis